LARLAPFAAAVTGLVLAFSALTKFLSPKAFVSTIGDYGIFADWMVLPLATGAVGLELALGLMLISGIGRRMATRIAIPLVVAFIILITRAIATGMTNCGCFGEVIAIPPPAELVLDFVMLAALLVVWRGGEDLAPTRGRFATSFGWVTLCVAAVIFLARGPVVAGVSTLDLERDDLAVLAQADPPLPLPQEGFLFFFSADCDHCWAYAGGVELMAQRVRGLEVVGVTFSGPAEMEAFNEAFQPSYPIHVLPMRDFNALVDDYPAGIWIQGGEVAGTWGGFVPGLRQIVEEGGYFYEATRGPTQASDPAGGSSPFGGTLRGRK
jgi:uncharacterized membrane protein YphA (DoxX/SURF4 family)